jgi:hypothetical protein
MTDRRKLAAALLVAFIVGWFGWHLTAARIRSEAGTAPPSSAHVVQLKLDGAKHSRALRTSTPSSPAAGSTGGADSSQDVRMPTRYPGARQEVIESYFPRDPEEWQGARVPSSIKDMAECIDTAGCGLGLACKDSHCGACSHDRDCAVGERCAIDHCLPEKNVGCTTRRDCRKGELCMFSGDDSPGPRYNANLRSVCQSLKHVPGPPRPRVAMQPSGAPREHLVDAEDMIQALRRETE